MLTGLRYLTEEARSLRLAHRQHIEPPGSRRRQIVSILDQRRSHAYSRVLWPLIFAVVGLWSTAAWPQLLSLRDPSLPLPAGGNGDSVEPRISPDGRYVLFSSSASDLVSGDNGQLGMDVFLRDRSSNTTVLVSANYGGTGGGNGSSVLGALSTNAQYVLFESDASDLVPGDTNGASDIFVRDLVSGTTRLVSMAADGGCANGTSLDAAMTPDGRFVAFVSTASNLVSGGLQGSPNVFVRDLVMGTNILVSAGAMVSSPYGFTGLGMEAISSPAITPDGRYVAFFSALQGLVPAVSSSSQGEIYLRDVFVGTTVWASTNAAALAAAFLGSAYTSCPSYHPALSDDGRFIAFKAGGTNGVQPALILQYDSTTGSTTVISTNGVSRWVYGDDVYGPEMTPDGRFIAFAQKEAPDVIYTNYCSVHLWDAQTGTNILISCDTNGSVPPATCSHTPIVSPDGRFVVFLSDAGGLVTNAVSSGFHVYLRDVLGGMTQLIDVDTNGAGTTDCKRTIPSLSPDGRFVAFCGPDGSLVNRDKNKAYDVFLRDATGRTTELVSQRYPGLVPVAGDSLSTLFEFSLSDDGRWVAFSSYADDLVPNDTNNAPDVFVRDLVSGETIPVSVGANKVTASGGFSARPVLSGSGRFVAFVSAATNLVAAPTNCFNNIFCRDLQAGTTVMVTVSSNGLAAGTDDSSEPVLSQDGRYIAFLSKANNLVSGAHPSPCVYWRDLGSGLTVALNLAGSTSTNPPSMSSDGRYVAFFSGNSVVRVRDMQMASNIYTSPPSITSVALSPGGSRLAYTISVPPALFVADLASNSIVFSISTKVQIQNAKPWSADSRFLALVTDANAFPGDANGTNDVYLCDLLTGMLTLVSVNSGLTGSANGPSDSPAVSGDGRFVVYRSFASDIVDRLSSLGPNIFVFDRLTGVNTLLTGSQSGWNWIPWVTRPRVSGDGGRVVFEDWDANAGWTDLNRVQDVYASLVSTELPPDIDGDGIPDWWMMLYFGHLTGQAYDLSRAQDDADGDGMSNLEEYLAGTNPTDPTSVFRLQITGEVSGSGAVLNWTAMPGRGYQLEYKNELSDPAWQAAPGTPFVAGNLGTLGIPADQPSRFYRIRLVN